MSWASNAFQNQSCRSRRKRVGLKVFSTCSDERASLWNRSRRSDDTQHVTCHRSEPPISPPRRHVDCLKPLLSAKRGTRSSSFFINKIFSRADEQGRVYHCVCASRLALLSQMGQGSRWARDNGIWSQFHACQDRRFLKNSNQRSR